MAAEIKMENGAAMTRGSAWLPWASNARTKSCRSFRSGCGNASCWRPGEASARAPPSRGSRRGRAPR
eukprot:561950-Pyramimonas_sp.AAC.1